MNILSKIDVTDGDQSVGRYICNPANVKNFGLRSHFSNPLDIDIFNRGVIEIFGQYIIQEKLRRKLCKRIILNQVSVIQIFTIYINTHFLKIILIEMFQFHICKTSMF